MAKEAAELFVKYKTAEKKAREAAEREAEREGRVVGRRRRYYKAENPEIQDFEKRLTEIAQEISREIQKTVPDLKPDERFSKVDYDSFAERSFLPFHDHDDKTNAIPVSV